jgi:hypothetical protein
MVTPALAATGSMTAGDCPMRLPGHDMVETLYCLVVFGVLTAQCLVAVWAALSPRHRLVRATVAWAAIAALMPVRAWWPALVLAINAVLVVAIISLARWRRAPPAGAARPQRPWRFALSDLLILTLLLGTFLALARYCHIIPGWKDALIAALLVMPLAGLTAGACLAVVGPAQGRWAAITAALIPVAAAAAYWANIGRSLGILGLAHQQFAGPRPQPPLGEQLLALAFVAVSSSVAAWVAFRLWQVPPRARWKRAGLLLLLTVAAAAGVLVGFRHADVLWQTSLIGIGRHVPIVVTLSLLLAALAIIVGAATWIADRQLSNPHAPRRRAVRALVAATALIALLPAGWIYWQMLGQEPYPLPQMVGTNNYSRLADISRQLADMRLGQGQALVDEAATLLAAPNYVPPWALEAEVEQGPRSLRGSDAMMFHQHVTLAIYEAAERADFDRAADYALAAVRYNTMLCRGGTTGLAKFAEHCSEGQRWLDANRGKLSPAKSQEVAEVRERSLAERDPPELLAQRDQIFADRFGGWSRRLRGTLELVVGTAAGR